MNSFKRQALKFLMALKLTVKKNVNRILLYFEIEENQIFDIRIKKPLRKKGAG